MGGQRSVSSLLTGLRSGLDGRGGLLLCMPHTTHYYTPYTIGIGIVTAISCKGSIPRGAIAPRPPS